MAKLLDLTNEYMYISELMEDPEADVESVNEYLKAWEVDFTNCAESIAKVITINKGNVKLLQEEEKRLQARRKALENKVEALTSYLEGSMKATGLKKFKTPLYSFGIQKNPERVVVDPEVDFNKIPECYLVYSAPTLDKKLLKEDLKGGKEISWAHLEQSEGLRIR